MAGSSNSVDGNPISNDNPINLSLDLYKYLIDFGCIYNSTNEYVELRDSVTRITMHSEYEDYVYPVLQVELVMSRSTLLDLQQNLQNIKFKVNIQRSKTTQTDKPSISLSERFVDNVILLPIDFDMNVIDQVRNTENSEDNDYQIIIDLIPQEQLDINKNTINGILKNVNMKDVALYCIGKSVSSKKLLFNEPDNMKTYEQVILPGLNLSSTLQYLQNVYGIYDAGLKLFFDFNNYYCISKDITNKKIITKSGEYENVFIYLNDIRDNSNDEGSTKDTVNNRYVIKVQNTGQVNISDISSREILGEDINIMSINSISPSNNNYDGTWGSGFTSDSKGHINSAKGIKKKKKYYNNYSNPYNETEFVSDAGRSIHSILVLLTGIDLDIVTPNKNYYIEYSNNDYNLFNGNYHLSDIVYTYTLDSNTSDNENKLFTMAGLCSFNKLPKV